MTTGPRSGLLAAILSFATAAQDVHSDKPRYLAIVTTPQGNLLLRLYDRQAPRAVEAFLGRLRGPGACRNAGFARVVEGLLVQTGNCGSAARVNLPLETSPELRFDRPGMVAMMNDGSSEFFITLAAAPQLNGKYTIFGEATESAEEIRRIAVPSSGNTPVPILKITVPGDARYSWRPVRTAVEAARAAPRRVPKPPEPPPAPKPEDQFNPDRVNRIIEQGSAAEFERLLDDGLPVNGQIGESCTPLGIAAGRAVESERKVALLLARGANPDSACGKSEYRPMHSAILFTNSEALDLLLRAGADARYRPKQIPSYLAIAVEKNKYWAVQALLAHGADPNEVIGGRPALRVALESNAEKTVQVLKQGGAKPVVASPQFRLMEAAEAGRTQEALRLLADGADPKATNEAKQTALMFAAHGGEMAIIRALLENGAPVNAVSSAGQTALLLARNTAVANLLLAHGADGTARDSFGFNWRECVEMKETGFWEAMQDVVPLLARAGDLGAFRARLIGIGAADKTPSFVPGDPVGNLLAKNRQWMDNYNYDKVKGLFTQPQSAS